MLCNEIILINTSAPLRNYMKRRPSHYAEILSRNNRVINISSAPLKQFFRYKNNNYPWEERIFFRIPGTKFRLIKKLNKLLHKNYLQKIAEKLPQKPLLWHFFSGNYDVVNHLPNKLSILEVCDDTPEFFAAQPEEYARTRKNEDRMTCSVDVVFTISDYLKQKKNALRPDLRVIRNGVSFEDFANTPQLPLNPADELFRIGQPVVGYTGAVSQWLDFDLVEGVAHCLRDVNFVFIGRIAPGERAQTERLNKSPNIFFLGERPYDMLPHYLKYFTLAHIPFKMNELVASVNPIKLYEYLAAGKRVVSVPMPEVVQYQREGLVEVAGGVEKYAEAVSRMLRDGSGNHTLACQELARQNTWESRLEEACAALEQKLKELHCT